MKTVAVTGAQGFVGSAIVDALKEAGHRVIPIVRASNGQYHDAVEWNIRKPYKGNFKDVDIVVHSAAKVDDWAGYKDSYETNVTGTKNVIDAFKNSKLIVYISSASVYGPNDIERVVTEGSAAGTNLLNAYSKTKYLGEQVVIDSSIPSKVILRPHIIYGPGDKNILPRLLKAKRFGRFLILGVGSNHISLTHIDNLVHAVSLLVDSEKGFSGEVFNIVDDRSDTVENIINSLKVTLGIREKNLHIPIFIASALGWVFESVFKLLKISRPPLITPYIVEQMTADHIIDCSKAKGSFGYCPKVDYSEGFKNL